MRQYFSKEDVLQKQVYSYDLKQYVIPVRSIKTLRGIDAATAEESAELVAKIAELKNDRRVLFNRCATLSGGSLCMFCGLREACDKERSVMRDEYMDRLRSEVEKQVKELCSE